MRHNDYIVVDECKMCGKPVMAARYWIGRMKGRKDCRENPRVPTCLHVRRKENERD